MEWLIALVVMVVLAAILPPAIRLFKRSLRTKGVMGNAVLAVGIARSVLSLLASAM